MLESQDFGQLFVVMLEELQGTECLGRIKSVLDRRRGTGCPRLYLLIGSTLGCHRELASGKIMLLAGGDGIGLAGFEDRIARVGVGLGLVREPKPGRRCVEWGKPDLTNVSGATSMVRQSEVHGPRRHKAFLD